ncbi:MAG: SDR family oxidoreductase [Chloroflexi bacterium]|nr:SDR family oxidoreductase [Chloroflexota bacterium]
MRSVVITGTSTGIGRACALWMDRAGWRVFAGVRKEADAQQLRAEASERLTPVFVDVTDATSIAAMAAEVKAAVGDDGLHGLVNNAGMATGGVLEFVELAELRRVLEVNVTGQLAVTQPLIPLLRQAKGRIVMMSSIAGRSSTPLLGLYAASKHALEALTDALRLELHPWGIQVVSIQPGTIATPIWGKALAYAEEVAPTYPPEALRLYGPLLDALFNSLRKRTGGGIPAEAVAEAVHHALTAPTPKTRYVVGRSAKIRVWIERLPDRLRDRVMLGRMPKYGG